MASTKSKQGPSVRVSEECKLDIARLSEDLGISQTEVMQRAIESLKREQFFNQLADDYKTIAKDPDMSAVLADENSLQDSLAGDGVL